MILEKKAPVAQTTEEAGPEESPKPKAQTFAEIEKQAKEKQEEMKQMLEKQRQDLIAEEGEEKVAQYQIARTTVNGL